MKPIVSEWLDFFLDSLLCTKSLFLKFKRSKVHSTLVKK
jgi:hypothetical protein